MVTCPRCQQPVDETVRSICPLCFTPIPQANPLGGPPMGASLEPPVPLTGLPVPGLPPSPDSGPAYPPPGFQQPVPQAAPAPMPTGPRPPMNSGARVSLTGEVIESGTPGGPPPSYVGGSQATAVRPVAPGAGSRAKSPVRRPQEGAPEKTGSGGVVGIVIALIVLLGAAGGGWYFWMHRTNPKDQALAVYKAYLEMDYKSAYSLSALGPEAAKTFPNADTFAADQDKKVKSVLGNSALVDLMKSASSTAAVGNPVVNGDRAEVPTSCQIAFMGRTINLKGTAHMINDFGIWKLDMKTDDLQKANKATLDMVGKADTSGLGGR